jgi:hypothetical protein
MGNMRLKWLPARARMVPAVDAPAPPPYIPGSMTPFRVAGTA